MGGLTALSCTPNNARGPPAVRGATPHPPASPCGSRGPSFPRKGGRALGSLLVGIRRFLRLFLALVDAFLDALGHGGGAGDDRRGGLGGGVLDLLGGRARGWRRGVGRHGRGGRRRGGRLTAVGVGGGGGLALLLLTAGQGQGRRRGEDQGDKRADTVGHGGVPLGIATLKRAEPDGVAVTGSLEARLRGDPSPGAWPPPSRSP